LLYNNHSNQQVGKTTVGRQSEGLLTVTTTSINTEEPEPQPHDSQNWIIEPLDYR